MTVINWWNGSELYFKDDEQENSLTLKNLEPSRPAKFVLSHLWKVVKSYAIMEDCVGEHLTDL